MAEPLTIRIAGSRADALRTAAAARGGPVGTLVGDLVSGSLAVRGAPDLPTVLTRLRDRRESLEARGLTGLLVFGSVARGEAQAASDVDLLAELVPEGGPPLVGLASLRAELTDLLRASADLVDRDAMRPEVLTAALREAVRVW